MAKIWSDSHGNSNRGSELSLSDASSPLEPELDISRHISMFRLLIGTSWSETMISLTSPVVRIALGCMLVPEASSEPGDECTQQHLHYLTSGSTTMTPLPTREFLFRLITPRLPSRSSSLPPSLYAPLFSHRVHASGEGHDRGVLGDGVHWFLRETRSHSDKQHHHGRISLER